MTRASRCRVVSGSTPCANWLGGSSSIVRTTDILHPTAVVASLRLHSNGQRIHAYIPLVVVGDRFHSLLAASVPTRNTHTNRHCMGAKSAELALAGELARADAVGFVSVMIGVLVSLACVICAANLLPSLIATPPPPPPPRPPLLSIVTLGDLWSWYANACSWWA